MDGFIVGGDPEQVRAQLEKAREELRLTAEEHTRKLDDFVESMDEEQLKLLQKIIRQVTNNPDYGMYLNGWISHMLKSKFSVCQFCGDKHESPEDWIKAHADNLPGITGPAPWMREHPDEF